MPTVGETCSPAKIQRLEDAENEGSEEADDNIPAAANSEVCKIK